jgi:hypothetical protein
LNSKDGKILSWKSLPEEAGWKILGITSDNCHQLADLNMLFPFPTLGLPNLTLSLILSNRPKLQ